ncbi:MAG: glycosyl transferase [Bacteroidetes bacterium]|nr:glycosyl transferase [Bacteroidota bacterium]
MTDQLSVPVLLVAFNRPDTTLTVFNRIRDARPLKLYVAVDGPREEKEGELNLVEEVRQIVQNVNWTCETHYHFNEKNKGAEITVSSAISWVFEQEEYAIILEDDIVAPLTFFKFAQEMLYKFKDDERIGTVSGSNYTPVPTPDNTDYFFAKYGHSWGWATWKRAWHGFDLNVKIPDEHLTTSFLKTITNSKAELNYYRRRFKSMQKKGPGNSTWDAVGLYFFRINNRMSIIPKVNLTTNIGVYGLHARGRSKFHFKPMDEDFVVKKHPEKVECFVEFDRHHFQTHIYNRKPILFRIINKIFRHLK